jgi:DNA repair protein RadD
MCNFLLGENIQHVHRYEANAALAVKHHFESDAKNEPARVVLPTVCGKTGVAVLASYACGAIKVLVITHSVTSTKQVCKEFSSPSAFIIRRGVVQPDAQHICLPSTAQILKTSDIQKGWNNELMVADYHKFGTNSSFDIDSFPANHFDLVIVHDGHHCRTPNVKNIVNHFPNAKKAFLISQHQNKKVDQFVN